MQDERAAAPLSPATTPRGLAAKRDYVRSLEQRRDEEALAGLVECLADESGYLRELAEGALLRWGEPSGPALVPLLRRGLWFSRASAARALGRLGYAPAAGPLLELAGDPIESVSGEALAALIELARRGGLPRVAAELHRLAPESRRARLARLSAMDPGLAEPLARLLGEAERASEPERLHVPGLGAGTAVHG